MLLIFSIFTPSNSHAEGVPLTINGTINCAHPDNAITTTCRGESTPEPVTTAPVTTEAPAAGTSIRYSGDRALNCALEPDASDPLCLPLTINGVINCENPDNAITTTCRGENPPEPTPLAPVTTEPAPVGSSIRNSGDVSIDCSLPLNSENTICLPMTNADGSLNCEQADNAQTTTCWNAFQESKAKGEEPGIDCANEKFSGYPVCTGIKPEAVIVFESTSRFDTMTTLPDTAVVVTETSTSTIVAESATVLSSIRTETRAESPQGDSATGTIAIQSKKAKSTAFSISLAGSARTAQIIATKKGARTITREIVLEDENLTRIQFSRSLKGYLIKLLVDGTEVDRVRI